MFSFLLDFKKGLQKIKFNYKLRFIMFKVSLVFFIALMYNGCASSTSTPSAAKVNTPSTFKFQKRMGYAELNGCKVMQNGYMVCPKSMNR